MKTRVCHITSAHPRYDGRIFQKECASLAEAGYDVCLLVNDDRPDEVAKGVNIYSLNKTYKGRVQRMMTVNDLCKKALQLDAKIYHLHDPELLLLAKKLKRYGKKVIFDSHEFYREQIMIKEYIPMPLRRLIAGLYYKYETNVFKAIDAVVGVRPFYIDGKEKDTLTGRCKNVIWVGNYPKLGVVDLPKRAVGRSKEFTVCYTGGLSHERGITHLIEACHIAGCRLILAGAFSTEEYHSQLKERDSYVCVDYRGMLPIEGVYEVFSQSDVGMATFLDAGQYYKIGTFSVKVFEYFQMKMPVILSDYPYALEMNERYHFGLCVRPDDPEQIAEAIVRFREDKRLRETCAQNGYELYKSEMNWEGENEKLLKLYGVLTID